MRASLPTSLLLLLFMTTHESKGAQDLSDGRIVADSRYTFPDYGTAAATTDVERYASRDEYESAAKDRRFEFRKITYLSDGLRVICYVYRPEPDRGTRKPAIVFNRGSYVRGDVAPELIAMFHRLARAGYVILAPMYRGSDGGEGRDEMGGADLDDLLNVAPLARRMDFIDSDNLFLYGESRGGMMALQALREGFPARAAAVFGAFTDLRALLGTDPDRYQSLIEQIWPDFQSREEQILRRRSALSWTESIKTPLLLMHGADDSAVPVEQTLRFALRLQRFEKDYELIIFEGADHILSQRRNDRDRRVLEWFERHGTSP